MPGVCPSFPSSCTQVPRPPHCLCFEPLPRGPLCRSTLQPPPALPPTNPAPQPAEVLSLAPLSQILSCRVPAAAGQCLQRAGTSALLTAGLPACNRGVGGSLGSPVPPGGGPAPAQHLRKLLVPLFRPRMTAGRRARARERVSLLTADLLPICHLSRAH